MTTRIPRFILLTGALVSVACGDPDSDRLTDHEGYWQGSFAIPGAPATATVVNDVHVDVDTRRITVYAQAEIMGTLISPPQVGPGECTTLPDGTPVCFHPNAVYLDGSGVELDAANGEGEWWVKHSWVVGGEGYENCELMPVLEVYDNCVWVEADFVDDESAAIEIGNTAAEVGAFYNIRTPTLGSPSVMEVASHLPDPDSGEFVRQEDALQLECTEQNSAFDGESRPCPSPAEE